MISQQLQDELSVLMIRASLKGKYGMVEEAEKNGITLMQALTLCLLNPHQPVPMHSLAIFLSCDKSNITVIVERLVAASFLSRKEWPQDRRIKTIELTEKGIALRRKLLHIAAEKRLPLLASLTSDETHQLITLLNKATGETLENKI